MKNIPNYYMRILKYPFALQLLYKLILSGCELVVM